MKDRQWDEGKVSKRGAKRKNKKTHKGREVNGQAVKQQQRFR